MSETLHFDAMPAGFYHAILNSIRDPFNILGEDYRILWANHARAAFHQQDLRDMIGQRCYEMFQRRDVPCVECPVRVVFKTRKPCIMEKSVTLPDGTVRWGDVRAYPIFDEKGKVFCVIQIMIDITNRKSNNVRQKRYIESLETTIREINEKEVDSLIRYEPGNDQVNLTKRETEILRLVANGFSNAEVGNVLAISPHTVKTHLIAVLRKLGVTDRTQAATWAVRHKLI